LDAETLELLEEKLIEFAGTVLMVSHDRAFLNNVVTSTIVFEPDGLNEYVGGFDDWQRQRAAKDAAESSKPVKQPEKTSSRDSKQTADRPRKLKYKEKQELESLPADIEAVEADLAAIHEQMGQPEFYQQPGDVIAAAQASAAELQTKLDGLYARWEELEMLAG
jgi:ATP-binding cassette subfamily F protein uup